MIITTANVAKRRPGAMETLYFNPQQTKELISIGDTALILMLHYVAIAKQPHPNMEDSALATMLCKSERTIKRTRLALIQAGWFHKVKTTKAGITRMAYFVGKDVAMNSLKLEGWDKPDSFKVQKLDQVILPEPMPKLTMG